MWDYRFVNGKIMQVYAKARPIYRTEVSESTSIF